MDAGGYDSILPMRNFCNLCMLLMLVAAATCQTPSTPAERARLAAIDHKLETNPLDTNLRSDREWAIKWLIGVPDITVSICPSILGDYHKYKYSAEITAQLMLGGATFQIENPDKAPDKDAQLFAQAESALKAYKAILQQEPKSKTKSLDEVLEIQEQGNLKQFVLDAAKKSCHQ